MLIEEIPTGKVVKLNVMLWPGQVTSYAAVRQRNKFRCGFHFLGLETNMKNINRVCPSATCHLTKSSALCRLTLQDLW
jgi:hypothetical protein